MKQWPIAPSAPVWKLIAGVGIVGSLAAAAMSASTAALVLAVVVCVAAAWALPVPASLGFAFLLVAANSGVISQGPLVLVGAIALTAIVGLRSGPAVSVSASVVVWYLLQTDIVHGTWVPIDLTTAVILLILLAASWACGYAMRSALVNRSRESARFREQLELERERTVKALHGSVAASLTSVVLRSEALAMESGGETAEAARQIAEDARQAMREVRELIRFARDDDSPQPVELASSASLAQSLNLLAETLRSHGFNVIASGLDQPALGEIALPHAPQVCRELQTNLLKYADPAHPVIVAAVADDDAVTVAIQNTIAARQRDVHMTTGIGLSEAAALMRQDGATLTTGYEGDRWRYELVVR